MTREELIELVRKYKGIPLYFSYRGREWETRGSRPYMSSDDRAELMEQYLDKADRAIEEESTEDFIYWGSNEL